MLPSRLLAGLLLCLAFSAAAGERIEVLHAKDRRDAEIAAGGQSVHFALPLVRGGFARVLVDQTGLDVAVTVAGPDHKPLKEVDFTGKGATELVEIAAPSTGTYDVSVSPSDPKSTGRFTLRVDAILDAAGHAALRRVEAVQRQQARAWVAAHAIPLAGTDPALGLDDMKPLAPLIGDARVVMMGEATHGTREFFQLKHRMLEYLVREKGFNVFAIEATMPEAFRINRYVVDGEGDPARALEGLYFWTWDTEEVFEMIQWMRAYNADPAHPRKLKFYGFDMQYPQLAARNVLSYLARVDAAQAAQAHTDLAAVVDGYAAEGFLNAPAAVRARLVPQAQALLQRFDAGKAAWIARTSADDFDVARQNAVVIGQFARLEASDDDQVQSEVRAKSMADNLLWIAAHEGPDAKVMGWAHNGHVTLANDGYTEMGGHLKAALGEKLRVFGFAFAQGGFQSFVLANGGGLAEFHVPAPAADSLDALLADAGKPLYVLDLHAIPTAGPVTTWFGKPRAMQSVGAVFDPSMDPTRYEVGSVRERYDALIFVDRTSAARPMPWGHRLPDLVLPAPSNLDFERGEPGDLPSDWSQRPGEGAFGYHVAISTDHPHGGKASGQVFRLPGPDYGLSYGRLSQIFDAAPYRGQRVRVHAWMRAEVHGDGNRGHLALRIRGGDTIPTAQPDAAHDDNYRNPVVSAQWQERTVEADVSKDAAQLEINAILVGDGSVWIDDVSIQLLGAVVDHGAEKK